MTKSKTPVIPFDATVDAARKKAGDAVAIDLIVAAVRAENGSRDAAAARLGLKRRTFFRRCEELGEPLRERLAAIDAELRPAREE